MMPVKTGRAQKHVRCMLQGFAMTVVGVLAPMPLEGAPKSNDAPPIIEVGAHFPELAFPSLADGSASSIKDYRGKKVVLHVFASW